MCKTFPGFSHIIFATISSTISFKNIHVSDIYICCSLDLFLTRLCLEKLSAGFPLVFLDESTNISRFNEITLGNLRTHAISEFFQDTFANDFAIHLRVKHFIYPFSLIYIINIHYFPQSELIVFFSSFMFCGFQSTSLMFYLMQVLFT